MPGIAGVGVGPSFPAYPGFTPARLSGCVLWLRADLGVTKDGSNNVSAWADQSSAGHHATAGTAPLWVASGLNGFPVVRFNGSTHRLALPSITLTAYTLLMVHTVASKPAFAGPIGLTGNAVAAFGNYSDGSTTQYWPRNNAWTGSAEASNVSYNDTAMPLPVAAKSYAWTSSGLLHVNGAAKATLASGTGFGHSSFLGYSQDFFGMDCAEVVVCSSVLSAADITRWESYARQRWALY